MNKIAGASSTITNPAVPWTASTPALALGNLISAFMALLITIGVIIFLFNLILGAIEYMSAGGDKGKIESAKQKLSNAMIGIVILFSFFALVNLAECFFGIGLREAAVGPFSVAFVSNAICQ